MNDLTVDVDDFWRLPRDERTLLSEWLEEHLGEPVGGAHVYSVTLGEGVIEVVRVNVERILYGVIPDRNADGEVNWYTQTIPSHRPPPVWKPVSTPVGNIRPDPNQETTP